MAPQPNRPVPSLGSNDTDASRALTGSTFTLEEEPTAPKATYSFGWLEDFVKAIRPDTWSDRTVVGILWPWLYLRNKPEVLTIVERELQGEIARRRSEMAVSAWLVALPQRFAGDPWNRRADLSRDQAEKWLKEGALLGGAELRGVIDRVGRVFSTTASSYLSRYESQVADGASNEDPVVARWVDGTTVEIRPRLGELMGGDGQFSWAKLEELRRVEPATERGGEVPLPRGGMETMPLRVRDTGGGWGAESQRVGDQELILLIWSVRR